MEVKGCSGVILIKHHMKANVIRRQSLCSIKQKPGNFVGGETQRYSERQRVKGRGGRGGKQRCREGETWPWAFREFLDFPGNWWISVPYNPMILFETLTLINLEKGNSPTNLSSIFLVLPYPSSHDLIQRLEQREE